MPSVAPRSASAAPTLILLVACVAQLMLILDDTIVNVALPTIGAELELSERSLSWVVNAYLLTFGGFLLIGGRVADRVGARRMFAISMAAFALASALCAAAWSSEVLVVSRGLQGLAGAMLSPAALAIILATFAEGPRRTRALAVWASLIGIGAATGLLLGGALTELLDWRWIFLINLPIAGVTLLLVPRVVPADDQRDARARPNLTGALLGTSALLLLVYTVVETHVAGWTSPRTLGCFAGVLALAVAFLVVERRSDAPLVPRTLLRRRRAMTANLLVLLGAAGLLAMFFFQTLYLQRVLGWSPLETGAAFLPFSAAMGISSGLTGRFLARVDARIPTAIGMTLAAAGLYWMSLLTPDSSYVGHLVPAFAVTAAGIGMAFVVLMAVATGDADERDGGVASALLTTGQQIGGAIGIAAMVTVASDRTASAIAEGREAALALTDGFSAAFEVQAAVMLVGGLIGIALLGPARRAGQSPADRPVPPGGGTETADAASSSQSAAAPRAADLTTLSDSSAHLMRVAEMSMPSRSSTKS